MSALSSRNVRIPAGAVTLQGALAGPGEGAGAVIFAHGSGSSRLSPRNVQVAEALNAAGLVTLLFDLLTVEEESDRANVFDIPLLAQRLEAATAWLQAETGQGRAIGYFGASTGAAAALWAAAGLGPSISAVVSRGGRPDLAGPRLGRVSSPTLLIVGGEDPEVLELNRLAQSRLHGETRLEVIPGATHLFEEPGALEEVARLAVEWFGVHLREA
jgi:putative phosphoribosyl transferase